MDRVIRAHFVPICANLQFIRVAEQIVIRRSENGDDHIIGVIEIQFAAGMRPQVERVLDGKLHFPNTGEADRVINDMIDAVEKHGRMSEGPSQFVHCDIPCVGIFRQRIYWMTNGEI